MGMVRKSKWCAKEVPPPARRASAEETNTLPAHRAAISLSRVRHRLGAHEAIELLLAQHPQLAVGLAQRQVAFQGGVRELGRAVVAQTWGQRRHQHERALDLVGDPPPVELDAAHAVLDEPAADVAQKTNRVEKVE